MMPLDRQERYENGRVKAQEEMHIRAEPPFTSV